MVGREVSHFRILERLGAGGMGVVYKAQDLKLDRLVALKFLALSLDSSDQARIRFVQEARAASALDHPNICSIYEVDETDEGRLFIAMAFYPGQTLKQRLESGPLPLGRALEIAIQVARGLAAAHSAGIIHRDIKPANIILPPSGEAKILDFGLSKLLREPGITRPGSAVGTVAYMSPEQTRGDEVDHRTDLWSLGVVLFEMLTGRLPFPGTDSQAIALAIQARKPAVLDFGRPDLAGSVRPIVAQLLAKRAGERQATAQELIEQLSGVMREVPSETLMTATMLPTASSSGASRLPAVPRWAWLAALGVLVVLALFVTLRFRAGSRGPPQFDHLAVLPFANLTGDPHRTYLAEGVSAGLITKLAEVEGLRVVARSQAWSYRDQQLPAIELARRLGVGVLLEGQVEEEAGRPLAVRVHLIDGQNGLVLWSRTFTGEVEGLFALQDSIARTLIQVLRIPLSLRERARLDKLPTASFKAYDVYLQGQQFLDDRHDPRGPEHAADLFRRALELDPQFPLAHAALSEASWRTYERDQDPAALQLAQSAAERAVELDPELPAAQVALARVYRTTGRYAAAIAELRQVLARHPKPDEAQRELAASYQLAGRLEEAEACLRAAVRIEDDWYNWNLLGDFLVETGKLEEAETAFARAVELAPPEISWPVGNLGAVKLYRGDFAGAVAVFERLGMEPRTANQAANMGAAYFFTGRLEESERFYRLAIRLNPDHAGYHADLADVLARLGRPDAARGEYDRAFQLTQRALADNPESNELRLKAARFGSKSGRCDNAVPLAEELGDDLPPTSRNAHYLATVFALCGERTAALEAVRQAIERGFSKELIRAEDEFRSLSDDPEFQRLTGEAAAAGATP